MFKKFNPKEDVASSTPVKSSVQRAIRTSISSAYPYLSRPHGPVAAPREEEAEQPVRRKGAGKEKRKEKEQQQQAAASTEPTGEDAAAETMTVLDAIWPKKESLTLVKCREHVSIITIRNEPIFFQHFDGPWIPTLKLLHKYPDMLPRVQVDRGAIKFVLGGANVMCPGLTSPTASLPTSLPKGAIAAIHAHGKENALGVGILSMSTDEIKSVNKGQGVELATFLGDDLWKLDRL